VITGLGAAGGSTDIYNSNSVEEHSRSVGQKGAKVRVCPPLSPAGWRLLRSQTCQACAWRCQPRRRQLCAPRRRRPLLQHPLHPLAPCLRGKGGKEYADYLAEQHCESAGRSLPSQCLSTLLSAPGLPARSASILTCQLSSLARFSASARETCSTAQHNTIHYTAG
jgi:hypothetical protein